MTLVLITQRNVLIRSHLVSGTRSNGIGTGAVEGSHGGVHLILWVRITISWIVFVETVLLPRQRVLSRLGRDILISVRTMTALHMAMSLCDVPGMSLL